MSAFISRLHKLSPKKNKERLFLQEKSDDNDKLHKSVGRLSNSTSCTLPVKSSSGSDSPRCSADGTRHALTDGEEDSTENRSVRQLMERSGKPPIKAKPRRPLRSISSDKGRSPEVSLSDSGSVSSLPSVRSLSQRYMPGRRFSETSADSDVFDAPSPTLRHGTLDKDREDPGQRGFDLREMRNVGSLDSTLTKGNWRSKPTEYWSTEDVVEWSEGLGIDKLPKIFHNAGITGSHLSNITDEILVELGLRSMVDRRKFLAEVKNVTNRKLSSLWSLKVQQVSMKRRNLERSTEQLHANLETLQKLNEEQEKKISSSLYEIQQEQLETKELLSREIIDQADPLYGTETNKPLCDWSTEDVVRWLDNNNLGHFIKVFQENGIAGKDLNDDNLNFLDHLDGFDTEAREALLSAIYRLQNPEPVSSQENDLEKIQTDADRQKYIAALQVAALEQSFSGSVMSGSTGTLNSSFTGSTTTLFVGNLTGQAGQMDGSTDTLASSQPEESSPSLTEQPKHAIQRCSPRRTNVYRKNHCVQDTPPSRPKSAPVSRETSAKWPQPLSASSLFTMLDTSKPVMVLCVKVAILNEQLGFKVKVTERGKVKVVHTDKNAIPLRKGDWILEACGTLMGAIETEEEFLLAVKCRPVIDMVIMREEPEKPGSSKSLGVNADDIVKLKNKLTQSENQWTELRSVLEELRDMDVGSEQYIKLFPMAKAETAKDTYKLEEQLQQLQTTLTNQVTRANSLDRELEAKDQALKHAEEERDRAVSKLHQLISIIDTDHKGVRYEDMDDSVPLWENLRKAEKEDVLQALKDTILESTRQKAYLDHLLGVVIDQAPYLLEELEDMEVPEEGSQLVVTRNIPEEWC